MTSIYTPPQIVNYNVNPPPDDGSQTDANRTKWATIKSKLADPVKDYLEAVNTETTAAFGRVTGAAPISVQSGNYLIQASDRSKTIVHTGSAGHTITLPDAAVTENGFRVDFVHAGTGTSILSAPTGQTINGKQYLGFFSGEGCTAICDGTAWYAVGGQGNRTIGKIDIFSYQPSLPFLHCDGAELSRTTYAELYAAIGTTFGVGDGSTTFNLPNMKGRAPVGVGQGNTYIGGALGINWALAQLYGSDAVILSVGDMPPHTHGLHGRGYSSSGGTFGVDGPGTDTTTASTGSGNAIVTRSPGIGLYFGIFTGVFV